MNSLFSQVCLQPSFICAPLLSLRALLRVFLISFSSPTLPVLSSLSLLLLHTLIFFIFLFLLKSNPFFYLHIFASSMQQHALFQGQRLPPIINACLLTMCFARLCVFCACIYNERLLDATSVQTSSLLIVSSLSLSSLSGPRLVCFTSSSFSTLSPVGPDLPLKCFAKAGKMEPNHLLNGFGPLQPAVAMLWWLQELLLLWRLRHNHCSDSRPLCDDDWLVAFPLSTTSGVFSDCHVQCKTCLIFLTNKETNASFKTFFFPVLTECHLSAFNPDWYSDRTMNGHFKNSRRGVDVQRALFQKHGTRMSVWECAAVSLRHLLNWLLLDVNSQLRRGWEWAEAKKIN